MKTDDKSTISLA
jgi:hypothetical protein